RARGSNLELHMTLILIIAIALLIIFGVPDVRKRLISRPAFAFFKRVLPPMSTTEREAMEAGDIWWDGELFSGRPNWERLLDNEPPKFSAEEQSFIDNQLE